MCSLPHFKIYNRKREEMKNSQASMGAIKNGQQKEENEKETKEGEEKKGTIISVKG